MKIFIEKMKKKMNKNFFKKYEKNEFMKIREKTFEFEEETKFDKK